MANAPPCIALTGSGGFVGQAVLQHLIHAGYRVKILTRSTNHPPINNPNVEQVVGDLFNDEAIDTLLDGAHTLIHLVGIIREIPSRSQTFDRIHHQATAKLIARAQHFNVQRFIHMSALGARPHAPSDYHHTKYLGEQAVQQSGLDWTIFRPSLILGSQGEFSQMIRDFWCNRLPPFVPYFGKGFLGLSGSGKTQPIAVDDVARCFVKAIDQPDTIGNTYALGGPDVMDWPTLYRRMKSAFPHTRSKPVLAIPIWFALLLTKLPGLPGAGGLPFNRAQVIMAGEDGVCDIQPIEQTFHFTLRSLEKALSWQSGDGNSTGKF